jgi:hypothetical protein
VQVEALRLHLLNAATVATLPTAAPAGNSRQPVTKQAHTITADPIKKLGKRDSTQERITCRQCRSKLSACISSMPPQPGAGDSCEAMACSECLQAAAADGKLQLLFETASLRHNIKTLLLLLLC